MVRMLETPEEMATLQAPLDASMATAGPHLRDVITDERRLTAVQLTELLQGMRLLVLATVTADGRPLTGPVDGYFLHGTFWFSTATSSVRRRHLARHAACSATHLPGDELCVTVHGRAEVSALDDQANGELLQAMLDEYLPKVGPEFEQGIEEMDAVGVRIVPEKMFTFFMEQ
jgi:general stress protein 26